MSQFETQSSQRNAMPRRVLALAAFAAFAFTWQQQGYAADKNKASATSGPNSRVAGLRSALSECEKKGFFAKQGCEQKARWKYCGAPFSKDQLWGKVPECPNSTPETNP